MDVEKKQEDVEPPVVVGTGQSHDGAKLTSQAIAESKIGDGLSIASFVLGLMSLVVGSFSIFGECGSYFGLFTGLPLAVGAMLTGTLGTRMQRIVNRRFGLGVAGAVLGLMAVIIIVLGVMTGWNVYNEYYAIAVGA